MLDSQRERDRQKRLQEGPMQQATQPLRTGVDGGGGTMLVPVVLRICNAADGIMYAQRLRYADADPVVGSYETYGDDLHVYPLPTALYEHYQEWVWPNDPTTDTVPLLAYRDRGKWIVMVAPKFDGSLLPAGEEVNECGFG